ncbi:phospholipase D-like domain-containing protein [Mesorhizobium sp. M0698]|uniref:phospholipase D-like domain-containing protein n=1 Tax=Mesorhizobium sp. M0698 TaxID=2956987 RepID=UPI00333B7ABC
MNRLDPPGFLDDLDAAGKEAWSQKVSDWLDRARAGEPAKNDGPRNQFFNPLKDPPAPDAQVAPISWNAFPRQVRIDSLSDMQRWRQADATRSVQDEYCEWSVVRDPPSGKIIRVDFTCEGPEYWEFLAARDPEKVVELYRRLVSPSVRREDLFVGGVYQGKNRFNNSTSSGIVHLIQDANTLWAEIWLGAGASIRRRRAGQDITDAQALIRCSRYGEPERNSDPFIGEQVNALARRLADITLNNPVGLYLHQFNPVGWAMPDGEDARSFWRFTRGSNDHFVRATYEVPPERGYFVGDVKIDGRPIQFGAQIADFITIKLEGLATRIGQSTVAAVEGCWGEAGAPPAVVAAAEAADELVPPTRLAGRRTAARDEAADRAVFEALPEALRRNREQSSAADDDAAAPPALLPYPRLPESDFLPRTVAGRVMAYASPDSTYAVTKKLIDSAISSLVIGIYDFSAEYMKEHLKRAMRRGVSLSLMLDTNSEEERDVLDELTELGANCVKAPSSSAGNPVAYFGNAHEKIIVVDGEIVMIQSGNWSENSIPFNEGDGVVIGTYEPGNRDMGMAVESRELAAFFSNLVARDMRLSQGQPPDAVPPDVVAAASPASDIFFEAAPPAIPTRLFSSITVTPESPISITPVITPENFHPTLSRFLRSAKRSVRIEQQYLRGGQPAVEALLREIADARADHPDLDVRIIVSKKYLDAGQKQKFVKAMDDFDFAFDTNYRYLSTRHFVHCHNKLVLVDDEKVLLGSQNWSTTGLLSNREASLLVEHAGIASYFAKLFDADWELSEPGAAPPDFIDPAEAGIRSASDFAQGGVVISSVADYRDL